MYIEDRLASLESKFDTVISLLQGSQIAGAGAQPAVAKQVSEAIAAAGGVTGTETQAPAEPPKRTRGRPAKTETAAAPQPDPFATDDAPAEPTRTLDEVRVSLIVFQAKNDQQKALDLLKTAGGADNLTQLKPESYNKVFIAAVPAGKLDINDVKAVLVKANERVANSGLEVLKKFGASNIKELKEENYAAAIVAAHGVK